MKAVACGLYHSVAIKEDGTLVQWDEDRDQRDDFPEGVKVKAVACGMYHSLAIKEDDTLVQWGATDNSQRKKFPDGVKVKAIAAGGNHSLAIKEDGTLIQWGDTRYYERADFPGEIKVKAVACGAYHSVAIKEDDTLVQWGHKWSGQLDDFPTGIKVKAVVCGQNESVAIKEDNTLVQWGPFEDEDDSDYNPRSGFPEDVKVKAVACYDGVFVAIKEDDTMIQWGLQMYSQNRDFPAGVKVKAVAVSRYYCVAIKEDGTLIQWGSSPPPLPIVPPPIAPPPIAPPPIVPPLERIEQDSSIGEGPNPYPKYATKIVISDLPHKTLSYNADTEVFDLGMYADVKLEEVLADEEKPLIIKTGSTFSALPKSYFRDGIEDGSLIRFGCTRSLGVMVLPNNVYAKNPFVYLKGLQSGNFMVLLAELKLVLDAEDIRAIELTDSGDEFANVAAFNVVIDSDTGDNYHSNPINVVSADHCQAGSAQKVYSITVLDLVKSGGRKKRTRKARRTYKKRKVMRGKSRKVIR